MVDMTLEELFEVYAFMDKVGLPKSKGYEGYVKKWLQKGMTVEEALTQTCEGAGEPCSSRARTQGASLVAWAAAIVPLLFLTPLFTSLPEAVLAALIIHAIWHILSSRKLLRLRLEAPVEVWFGVLALAGVVFIDVLEGMMIGLLASLAFVVYRSSRPHLSSLGRVPGTPGAYSDLARHPENAPVPGVLIVRLDAPLYYANALTARDRLKAMIRDLRHHRRPSSSMPMRGSIRTTHLIRHADGPRLQHAALRTDPLTGAEPLLHPSRRHGRLRAGRIDAAGRVRDEQRVRGRGRRRARQIEPHLPLRREHRLRPRARGRQ